MKLIIGNSGLIGTTLKEKIKFDLEFNSRNMHEYIEKVPDECDLYLSCLPATKWIINQNLESDIKNMHEILNIISKKKYKKIILISTIDVYYESEKHANEDYTPKIKSLNYGSNRYLFELLVIQFVKYEDIKIFRLPALFSKNIKKNILFDLINNNNVEKINKNSCFQWYNLNNLYKDINFFCENYKKERIFNLFPESIETEEIINLFPQYIHKTQNNAQRIEYNFKSKYFDCGYIKDKQTVLSEINTFIYETSNK